MQPVPSARRAFWRLVALGAGSLFALAVLLAWQGQRLAEGVWLACQSVAAAVGGLLPALGLLLPVAVLMAGLVAAAASAVWQLWNTRRLVAAVSARSIPLPESTRRLASRLELDGRVLLVVDADAYAFTQGLVHPRIWLSTAMVDLLDEDELAAVLQHERYHLLQRDPLRVWLSRAIAHGLFFVPAAADLRNTYLLAKEMEADAASQARAVLASALLKLLRIGAALPAYASVAAIGPLDATARRIERLLDRRTEATRRGSLLRPRHAIATLLVAAALFSVSSVATARAATPLTGGECGYTIQPQPAAAPVTPADYTPAGNGLYR
jgi:Zn-dependent protease with chaperone function